MSDKQPAWGPGNPHPLSQMKTELVWEGKYDDYGNRREIDLAGLAMPTQKIETVDQPRSEAAASGQTALFERQHKRKDDFRNMLVWGDNKLVMASLLKEFKGKVKLIYIDPPFDVGADFKMQLPCGQDSQTISKDQSTLEMVAYRDTWGKGTDSYISMMHERLILMRELLAEDGSIYLHCDSDVVHFLKLLLDEVFGSDQFVNCITWKRAFNKANVRKKFGVISEQLLFYSKTADFCWNQQYQQYDKDFVEKFHRYAESPTGEIIKLKRGEQPPEGYRRFTLDNIVNAGNRPNLRYEYKGYKPHSRGWNFNIERMRQLDKENRLWFPEDPNGRIRLKRYLDEMPGKLVPDVWDDLATMQSSAENVFYPTQKPEDLLDRIVRTSSNEGDLVADLFCGSGTTGAVAERLGRRWIMADLGRFATHTSRKRLIDLQRKLFEEGKPYRSFDVYNLGRYERQWWQKERLQGADEEHRRVVLEFFKAELLTKAPSPLIHGRKGNSLCHVDGIDSILTRDEVKAVAKAVSESGGKEVYCLAWEFEMDLRQHCLALEAEYDVKIKLIPIPREIMEKNRTSPPPFLEMAVLEAEPVYKKAGKERSVDIKLTRFLPSLAEVPSKELDALKERAVKSGMDFVDFWAIDFEWQPGKPFNHHWQDYRTRKDRSLKTISDAKHKYPKPGEYTACVKVVDTFGCDTSITVEVEV